MKKIILFLIILGSGLFSSMLLAKPVLMDQVQTKVGKLKILEQHWQDGDNPLNQFITKKITVKKRKFDDYFIGYDFGFYCWNEQKKYHDFLLNRHSNCHHLNDKSIVILASSFNVTIDHMSVSSSGKYEDSIEAVIASAGHEVWVIEDRMLHGDPAVCNEHDCSIMSSWGLEQRINDIKWLKDEVIKPRYEQSVVVGGITGGGMAAIATVDRYPDEFAGVFSTGALYSNDPATQLHNMQSCDDFRMAKSQGDDYLNVLAGFDPVVFLAQSLPDKMSPIFPELTNVQTLLTILGVPGFLGKNAYSADYVFALAKPDLSGFKYMDLDVFYEDYSYFGHLASLQHHIDINCAFTGERTFTSNLGAFEGKVLLLGGAGAMTPMMYDTAELFEQAKVRVINRPKDGGEADNYLVPIKKRKRALDKPLIKWLKRI